MANALRRYICMYVLVHYSVLTCTYQEMFFFFFWRVDFSFRFVIGTNIIVFIVLLGTYATHSVLSRWLGIDGSEKWKRILRVVELIYLYVEYPYTRVENKG